MAKSFDSRALNEEKVSNKAHALGNAPSAKQKSDDANLEAAPSFVQPTFQAEPTFSRRSPTSYHLDASPSVPPETLLPLLPWHETLASELRYILGLFVSTRIVLTAIGLVSYAVLPTSIGKEISWSKYTWLDMWGVWDSLWYMDIAQNGYSTATKLPEFPDQTNFPFFPLYPMLMKLIGGVGGDHYFLAGLLISNVCLLLSCYVLYKLVEMQWSKKIARRSVRYLFLFPVSFILSGVFTESLYLFLTLLCFYFAKKQKWWLAGVCGGLLSATRTLGILIALPLLYEYLKRIDFKLKDIRFNSLFLLLVPLGLLAFSVYTHQITGDYLFFKTNQAAWDREILNPVASLWQGLSQGVSEPSFKKLLECAFFLGAFALLSLYARAIGLAYWLFGMYSIFIPLSAGVASMARFTLPIFPLFIGLAILSYKGQWNLWLTLCLGGLQGALMVLWCTGYGLVI